MQAPTGTPASPIERTKSLTTDLASFAKENGVKHFMIFFTDLFGGRRAKLVPARAIADMQKDGAGFAGFSTWLDLHIKTGVEAEFFLLTAEGTHISDPFDTLAKPCYDQQAFMRRLDVIRGISDYMLELGLNPYQNNHEDANGQWEMNWDFDDAMRTADKHSFFKFMVKCVAEKHGMRATFIPKPIECLTGNGCHVHGSVWDAAGDKTRTIVFAGKGTGQTGEVGPSEQGGYFLGEIMKHASALATITNPTVNSYKHINAPRTTSGATGAPHSVTWTGNNRTHMVRVPGPSRFALRLPDGAANPYPLQAVIIAAGLSGLRTKADPGQQHDIDMYDDGHKVRGAPKLSLNLLDALRAFNRDKDIMSAMGDAFSAAYPKLKTDQWND